MYAHMTAAENLEFLAKLSGSPKHARPPSTTPPHSDAETPPEGRQPEAPGTVSPLLASPAEPDEVRAR